MRALAALLPLLLLSGCFSEHTVSPGQTTTVVQTMCRAVMVSDNGTVMIDTEVPQEQGSYEQFYKVQPGQDWYLDQGSCALKRGNAPSSEPQTENHLCTSTNASGACTVAPSPSPSSPTPQSSSPTPTPSSSSDVSWVTISNVYSVSSDRCSHGGGYNYWKVDDNQGDSSLMIQDQWVGQFKQFHASGAHVHIDIQVDQADSSCNEITDFQQV